MLVPVMVAQPRKLQRTALLAWAGWRMIVPARWRPLRIEGQAEAGNMILADGGTVTMQIKWLRPQRPERFDADTWLRRRLRALKADPDEVTDHPAPAGFAPLACIPAGGRRDGDGATLWYGYTEDAGLVIEIAMRDDSQRGGRLNRAVRRPIESLAVSAADEPSTWAIFGCRFEVPAGFSLRQHDLRLGNLSLQFDGPDRQTLLLRQIYPAALALNRRPLEDWLGTGPFKERRRYRADAPAEPLRLDEADRALEGVIRRGWKRIAFPLGWLLARRNIAAALHDTEDERLLIAEHDAPRADLDDTVARETLVRMNRTAGDQAFDATDADAMADEE